MFKNILFVVHKDIIFTDDPAFNKSMEIIKNNDGRMTIIKVIDLESLPSTDAVSVAEAKEMKEKIIEYYRIKLQKMLDDLEINNDIDLFVCTGIDFIEIIKKAESKKCDLIAKVEDFNSEYLSSSDFHLLRKAKLPVWIMRNQHGRGYEKMVVAIDLNLERSEKGQQLNKRIIDAAQQFSELLGVDIQVISCWSLYGENALRNNPFIHMESSSLKKLIDSEENRYQRLLSEFKNKYGKNMGCTLIRGNPAKKITEYVNSNGFDIVVMGTVARTGISGYFIGNTAENILQSIASSIVAIKPDDFKSPVTDYNQ